jgi:dTDP-4-dehydrorhamnose 3,5-epimerase
MYGEDVFGIGVKAFTIQDVHDERGTFSKILDSRSLFANHCIQEISVVRNNSCNILRGMHFQEGSYAEEKLIACLQGEIYDVLIDLRTVYSESPLSYAVWLGDKHEFQAIHVPSYFAHGYISTSETSTILYAMNKPYSPLHSSGLRWDDPHLGLSWPTSPSVVSERDKSWAYLSNGE